jgi:hypothetical protein
MICMAAGSFGDGAPGSLGDPGEVLGGADLERDGEVVGKSHLLGTLAENLAPVVSHAGEGLSISLLGQPLEIPKILRVRLLNPAQKVGQLAGLGGLAVDLFRCPIPGDDLQEIVDHTHLRVEEDGVDVVEPGGVDLEQLTRSLVHGVLSPFGARPASESAEKPQ